MKILETEELLLLNSLVAMEVSLINKAFGHSKQLGIVHLSNAITAFEKYLIGIYGNIRFAHCSEYRVFIVGLLKNIDNKYADDFFPEVLLRTNKNVSDEEIMALYKAGES